MYTDPTDFEILKARAMHSMATRHAELHEAIQRIVPEEVITPTDPRFAEMDALLDDLMS